MNVSKNFIVRLCWLWYDKKWALGFTAEKKKIKFRSPHSKIEIDFTHYLECQNKGEGKEAVEIISLKALP